MRLEDAMTMQKTRKIQETREKIKAWKINGYSIGFIPTMGYLHEGHQRLIQQSVQENHKTVVSVFVNPTQFASTEDLCEYPKDIEADMALCERAGVDLIFCPNAEEMYVNESCTFIDMDGLTKELCGKSRPTHFRGVCTVVGKLFNIITPNRAYFGEKDAQQLAVIKRMVRDLNMDVEVIGCSIVREADGLAKSSRNVYLNAEERKAALVLNKAVVEGKRLVQSGERNVASIVATMEMIIAAEPLAEIDYIELVDANAIEKITTVSGPVLAAIAVFVGNTRLIDNFICEV